jgi:hypothetical protein
MRPLLWTQQFDAYIYIQLIDALAVLELLNNGRMVRPLIRKLYYDTCYVLYNLAFGLCGMSHNGRTMRPLSNNC